MRYYHLRPWEIDELTPTECCVLAKAAIEEQQDKEISIGDAFDQARAWGMATPQQKLEMGYRIYGD